MFWLADVRPGVFWLAVRSNVFWLADVRPGVF